MNRKDGSRLDQKASNLIVSNISITFPLSLHPTIGHHGYYFNHLLYTLDFDWYLSDDGHDNKNCGRNLSSSCKTFDWLLGLFYNTSYKSSPILSIVTNTNVIIDPDLLVSISLIFSMLSKEDSNYFKFC